MKEHLRELVARALGPVEARNLAREYLQARILGVLQRAGAMAPLAFHGGTALRFLYATARYSEDLDFALERPDSSYSLDRYVRAIGSALTAEGYDLDTRLREAHVVQSAFVRLRGLPFELGLSAHREAVLAVKIEVDTRPPAGAGLETSLVRRHLLLHLQHHDRASLLAGKLHALLQRPYTKGRDVYDLLWYLSDPAWPAPNLELLNNALTQTGWPHGPLTEATWRVVVRQQIESLVWDRVIADVRPFLGPGANADILSKESLLQVLAE